MSAWFFAAIIAFLFSVALYLFIKRSVSLIFPISLLLAITPPIIWSAYAIFAFGLSELSIIFTIFLSQAFFVLAVNLFNLSNLPHRVQFLSQHFRLNVSNRIKFEIWPSLQSLFQFSLRLALLVGWLSIAYAESFGANEGVGALLLYGRQTFDWGIVGIAWLMIIGIAALSDGLLVWAWRATK